jgi:hypothetical protein
MYKSDYSSQGFPWWPIKESEVTIRRAGSLISLSLLWRVPPMEHSNLVISALELPTLNKNSKPFLTLNKNSKPFERELPTLNKNSKPFERERSILRFDRLNLYKSVSFVTPALRFSFSLELYKTLIIQDENGFSSGISRSRAPKQRTI